MSAFAKLRETNFTATEKRIADYILEHSAEMPGLSISTVAEECETSKSMVVQLCKTAGFMGYKDLCSQLLVEQAITEQQQETIYEDIHHGFTVSQICQITIRAELRSIRDTAAVIDADAISKAVEWISTASLIQLFGVGGSGVAALDLYDKLTRIGINARYSQDTHCETLETSSLNENCVVVVFSYNGRTKDMIEAVELSREMGARVISITRYGDNPVSELADIPLFVASNESLARVTAMSSRLSTLAMVDMLFACLASHMSDRIQPIAARNTEIAKRRRK